MTSSEPAQRLQSLPRSLTERPRSSAPHLAALLDHVFEKAQRLCGAGVPPESARARLPALRELCTQAGRKEQTAERVAQFRYASRVDEQRGVAGHFGQ